MLIGGEGLQPTGTATTVRVRDSEPLPTDGPFAETREQLGGYYLVDVEDLDAAIGWAARIPRARARRGAPGDGLRGDGAEAPRRQRGGRRLSRPAGSHRPPVPA